MIQRFILLGSSAIFNGKSYKFPGLDGSYHSEVFVFDDEDLTEFFANSIAPTNSDDQRSEAPRPYKRARLSEDIKNIDSSSHTRSQLVAKIFGLLKLKGTTSIHGLSAVAV